MFRRVLSVAFLAVAMSLTGCAMLNGGNGSGAGAGTSGNANASSSTGMLMRAGGGLLLQQLLSGNFKLGSIQNVAGVLGYCKKQGYAPSATEMAKEKLLDKLGLQQPPTQSESYQNGLMGILQSAQGGTFNFSTLKDMVGKRACKAVADRAVASFLGG